MPRRKTRRKSTVRMQAIAEINQVFGVVVDTDGETRVREVMEASGVDAPNRDQYIVTSYGMYPASTWYED